MGKLILTLGLVCMFLLAVAVVGCEKQAPPKTSTTTTTNTTSTTSTTVAPAAPAAKVGPVGPAMPPPAPTPAK
jgi:hypothetical protein